MFAGPVFAENCERRTFRQRNVTGVAAFAEWIVAHSAGFRQIFHIHDGCILFATLISFYANFNGSIPIGW
jgi:hypothetical protein